MDRCPECGIGGYCHYSDSCGMMLDFHCGSSFQSETLHQSSVCRELCDLRKRVAFAEKWREVVLSKTEATLGGVYSMMTKTPDKFGAVAEMFDAAVRKEMECES